MATSKEWMKDYLIKEKEFKYSMLGRLAEDCRYFLGYGNRSNQVLWAKDVDDQLEFMKALFESFSEEDKPKFISLSDIEDFRRDMQQNN